MIQLQTQIFEPYVRQLLFSVFGDDLLSEHPSPITLNAAYEDFFIELNKNPQQLHGFIEPYSKGLLGHYFEGLWLYFLSHAPGWQVLAHNIQVQDENRTLGELDILAKHVSGETYHFELASKFYLRAPQSRGEHLSDWVGPNAHDKLSLKLTRLIEHQLPMLFREQCQNQLIQRQLPSIYQQNIILKGNLFLPATSANTTSINANSLPSSIKQTHGHWLHASNVRASLTPDSQWSVLTKPQWLCPFYAQKITRHFVPLSTAELIHLIQLQNESNAFKPVMVVKLTENEESWIEESRFMIVADHWPKPT